MICPTCHSENPEGSLFCTTCGSSLASADVAPKADAPSAVCPACGAAVEEGFAFCTACRAPLASGVSNDADLQADAAARVSEPDDAATTLLAENAVSFAEPEPDDAATTLLAENAVSFTAAESNDAATTLLAEDAPAAGAPTPDGPSPFETYNVMGDAPAAAPAAGFCSSCGAPVQPDEAFCSSCGARIGAPAPAADAAASAVAAGQLDVTVPDMARASAYGPAATTPGAAPAAAGVAPYATMPAAAPTPEPPAKRGGKGKIVAIVVGVLAVLALIGGGIGWYLHDQHEQEVAAQQAAEEAAHAPRKVTIDIIAEGWDTKAGASRLPVRIVGEDLDGEAVDEIQYVASDGTGIEIRQGEYEFAFPGSPIAADGTIYTPPSGAIEVSVSSEDADAVIDATGDTSLTLAPIDALEVTDEQIEAAYQLALADEDEGAPDADSLRSAAVARHDEAVAAKEEAEAAAAEEAAREARHVVAANYELYLPEYWDGRVTVEVDGNTVTIRSKAYPRLDVCTIQVQRGATIDRGDYLTSCMGDVDLGQGHYASVWATRWGPKIAELYSMATSDPDDYYSLEEATEIVDLQTGGAIAYMTVRDDFVETGNAHSQLVDDYLRANVVNAITPR